MASHPMLLCPSSQLSPLSQRQSSSTGVSPYGFFRRQPRLPVSSLVPEHRQSSQVEIHSFADGLYRRFRRLTLGLTISPFRHFLVGIRLKVLIFMIKIQDSRF